MLRQAKVLALQQERIATLKEVVDLGNKLAEGNRIEITDALQARTLQGLRKTSNRWL